MSFCPFSQRQCMEDECELWFTETSKKGKPVLGNSGCSLYMTARYLMEIRPEVVDINSNTESIKGEVIAANSDDEDFLPYDDDEEGDDYV